MLKHHILPASSAKCVWLNRLLMTHVFSAERCVKDYQASLHNGCTFSSERMIALWKGDVFLFKTHQQNGWLVASCKQSKRSAC